MRGLQVLADDLSGAADCAASFTGAAGAVPLLLGAPRAALERFALDTDSRSLDASAAAARWRELGHVLGSAVSSDTLLFKKVDSTLRGHVGEEVSALIQSIPGIERVVIAPAFPEQGRTFVDGRLHVHGKPKDASLAAIAERIAQVAENRTIAMPMSVSGDDDLRALVDRMRISNEPTLWVGSSGLARALAGTPPRRINAGVLQAPMLIVVGSYSAAAREQVRAFARQRPEETIAVSPNGGNSAASVAKAAGLLEKSGAALLHLDFDDAPPSAPSRRVIGALAAALGDGARRARTLVATGGDTARAMLEALGIDALTIEGELEPGIPVSAPIGDRNLRVVLKAGGFGDNGVFLRMHP
jgi:uncharacterized protein YgbK (DUF1537 family)